MMAEPQSRSFRICRDRLRNHQSRDPIIKSGSTVSNTVVARKATRVSSERPVKHTAQAAASRGTSKTVVGTTTVEAIFIVITDIP